LLIVIPALRITVIPVLGNHRFVKLKVVTQNRWLLSEGSLTGAGSLNNKNCTYHLCKQQSAVTIIIIDRCRFLAKRPI